MYPPVAIIATPKRKMPAGGGTVVLGAARAAKADLRGKLEEAPQMECRSAFF